MTYSTEAADWPHWRRPNLNGSTNEQNLPEFWNGTENISWISPLPGPGGATPIICDGKVLVSSMVGSSDDFADLCFDAKDGSKLWEKPVGTSTIRLSNNNAASPSPVTDGKTVIFFYGNGRLACFDYEGNRFWSRNLVDDYGTFSIIFGYSASPLLFQDKLYCTNESGEVVALAASDEFKILFETKIDEAPIRSSVAVADGCLFIRTAQNLYCIGK